MLAILAALGCVTYVFIDKDRQIMTAMELQNALFAGAAKLATQFCIILKYDGTVIYVDPDYNRKFFHLKNQGIEGLDALCASGGLDSKSKEKLLLALSEGRTETVSFTLPEAAKGEKSIALTLEPIGVYARKDQKKKLSLAVKPLTRPSGYFFLHARRTQDAKEHHDYLNDFSIGFYALKGGGEFLVVNEVLASDLGYRRQELMSGNISFEKVFFNEKDAAKIAASEDDWQGEGLLKSKAGEPVRVLISQMVIKDESKKTSVRRGIIIKLVSDEFASVPNNEANQEVPNLLQNSPIATAILDIKGNILQSNKAFHDIVECTEAGDGQRKWNLLDIVTGDARVEVKALLSDRIGGSEGNNKPMDVSIKSENDTTASLYISRITNGYGELKGLICHLIDTTELKNLELRFVHSQKMQAVGQLAGGIAHDFNNLLTAMMGFCDLLLMRHPAGDQSFADIMQIKQNANRAANLVRQLLAFSRKQTLQPEILNITDVFADLSNLIGRLIGENIELNMTHGKDLWRVKVDKGQLEQVIINLAVNARDAMPGGGCLSISTSNITIDEKHPVARDLIPPAEDEVIGDGDYILVEVSDTGCGMDKALMGKIFEPFFSTKEIGSGTGLGLSTVYGIVKQTDGYIYVRSKLKKGTTFSIFLKRCESRAGEGIKPVDSSMAVATADLTGTGTILLVEDEVPVRLFSTSALTNKGYTLLEAESGEQAIEIIKERGSEVDIIITDVVMPGMNGPSMIEKVRKKYPDIKVIFISGYAEDAFFNTYGEERGFHFLAKPYTLKQLATKVKEVMKENRKK